MEKKCVQMTITAPYLRTLNHLIEKGIYLDREEVIRDALRRLFRCYEIEPFYKELVEKNEESSD